MKKKAYTFSTYKNLYQNDFKYNKLEKYFEIQRTEHEAAKSIQKIWRKTRVLLPWRKAVYINKVVILVQKRFRGFLARKWVAEWYYTRNNIVINWQAHVRRYLSNLHIRPKLYHQQLMVIKIQKIIRGKLARLYYILLVRNQAAIRIQIMWRGLIARLLTDKLWLQKVVIPIQNFYRKCIAQRKYKNVQILRNTAALIIQKQYRNFYAKQSLGKRLYDREISYRDLNIKGLVIKSTYSLSIMF